MSEVILRDFRVIDADINLLDFGRGGGVRFPRLHRVFLHLILRGEIALQTEKSAERVIARRGDALLLFYGDPHTLFVGASCAAPDLWPSSDGAAQPETTPRIKVGGGAEQALALSAALELTYVSPSAYANRIAPDVWIMRAEASEDYGRTLAMDSEQVLTACNGIGGRAFATMLLNAHFAYIVGDMTMRVPSSSVKEDFRVPNRRRVSAILREIQARPEAQWTVAKLAHLAGMSRSTFAEAFHDNVGKGPLAFVQEYRMKRAAQLLSIQQMTFHEVANRVGYRLEASFARAFKRHYGMSPREFVATRKGAPEA